MSNGQYTGGYDEPEDERPPVPDGPEAYAPLSRDEFDAQETERRIAEWNQTPEGRLPHNFEAEAALLGALMIDNRLIDRIGSIVDEDSFYDPLHGRIFAKAQSLIFAEKTASPVTLRPYFEADEDMKELGGVAYLAQLTGSGAAIIGAVDFAQQVRDLAQLRRLHDVLTTAAAKALDTSEDVDPGALLAEIDGEITNIGMQATEIPSATLAEAWDDFEVELKEIAEGKPPAGFAIAGAFRDWNAIAGRMEESDLILLGGRPSMGKTAVGLAVALGAAAAGEATEFYSLEMDKRKMTRRALAHLIYQPGVTSPYKDIVAGRLTMDDYRAMGDARKAIADWPFYISDPANMDVEDLAPAIRRRQRQLTRKGQTLKLVVVDYLGRFGTKKRFNSETEQASYISRVLKHTAKACKVTMIVLVQLSRAVEQRDNKRPMLADLKQSGSLEQDADTVIFVYRDEYYLERAEPPKGKAQKWEAWSDEMRAVRDQMEIYSSKRREGALLKKIAHFFTGNQAVRDSNFFTWRAEASPIGPQEEPADMFAEERG